MAVTLSITSPTPNQQVGTTVTVTGTIIINSDPFPGLPPTMPGLSFMWVTFGTNGPNVNVTLNGSNWSATGPMPLGTAPNETDTITVTADGTLIFSDDPGEDQTWEESDSVTVVLQNVPPQLTIVPDFPVDVVPPSLPFQVLIHGTTNGAQAHITQVALSLDGGAAVLAQDLPPGDWSSWQIPLSLDAGDHSFVVTATDLAGRTSSLPGRILVHEPFEETDPAIVFGPTIYVRELCDFIGQYVLAGGTAPTRAGLAARFRQPYDRIVRSDAFATATAPVDQRRVAVEVLRAYLTSPAPAALDQGLRQEAYEGLLRELGTSSAELRQARVAPAAQRALLAERLGIELGTSRPDHLDDLTISPDDLTDAQLETLFGFRSMSRTDPFEAIDGPPSLLTWQQAALRGLWRAEDAADRDGAGGPLPIIDPDLVTAANLASQQAGDVAHDLWAARTALVGSLAGQIDAAVGDRSLAAFDHLVATYLGAIDLAAQAARDAAGEDISDVLLPLQLGLDAFRRLAGLRALLGAGALLASEWVDVRDILVQVHKVRLFPTWRQEERAGDVVLEPQRFLVDPAPTGASSVPAAVSTFRADWQVHLDWQRTLAVRAAQQSDLVQAQQAVVRGAEATVLPDARDQLVALIGSRHDPVETPDAATERLTRELCIDLRADSTVLTTHADQAAQTLLEALLSVRSGRLPVSTDNLSWSIAAGKEPLFDREWQWMGAYATWYAAITAFAFPDNQLFPGLYVPDSAPVPPSASYVQFLADLRAQRVTVTSARDLAQQNWDRLFPTLAPALQAALTDPTHPLPLTGAGITELHTNQQLDALRTGLAPLWTAANQQPLRELFWLVPVALGLALTDAGQYTAALDWYQYAYAYQLPAATRRVFPGLVDEADIKSTFGRTPAWPADGTNPHEVALERANAYTRFTIISIVRSLLAYGDNAFVGNTAESDARARTLYETALDLITSPDAAPEVGTDVPFPANPVLGSLTQYAQTALNKIHRGLNIASAVPPSDSESILPSQYRYSVLADRARNLVTTAAQLETAFLNAAEQADAGTYTALQANHDLQVAQAMVGENDLKVQAAGIGVEQATSQWERAGIQATYYTGLINGGLNEHEVNQLDDLEAARDLAVAGGVLSGIGSVISGGGVGGVASGLGALANGLSQASSLDAQIEGTQASFERRAQDWQFQASLAAKDGDIGREQIALATTQQQIAVQERDIADLNLTFSTATANFVATKFTSAELFEWMSGVLNQVYAYFLREATSVALLAQAQLAFERQEPNRGLVQDDYWQGPPDPTTGQNDTTNRQGLTGSERLLEDLTRLDEYAFETNRRKLHLTQTFSLAQIAGAEMQQFRQTGVMSFATPQELFDRRFPGHYLRLVNSVTVSVIALVPPVTGVSATLSTSGVSRTVVSRDVFQTITLRRDPEAIAFTSPSNATGLFAVETDTGLLRPFEAMGVDAVWRLELPQAANQFDFRTISDVLLTLEYTALDSQDYRHAVIRSLDRGFSGDRVFSLRDDFPDAWFALNNPDSLDDPTQRMHAVLALTRDDFPAEVQGLTVSQLSLYAIRANGFTSEVTVESARHTGSGPTASAGPVTTLGGIVSTRRLSGEPWLPFVGNDPTGQWDLAFDDTPTVRGWFTGGQLEDVAIVFTLAGTTPAWP